MINILLYDDNNHVEIDTCLDLDFEEYFDKVDNSVLIFHMHNQLMNKKSNQKNGERIMDKLEVKMSFIIDFLKLYNIMP